MKVLIPLKLLLAIPVCAAKWVMVAVGYYANPAKSNHDKDGMRLNWWGFADPRLPAFGWTPHEWTNWLVEWCRLGSPTEGAAEPKGDGAQRAAKLGGFAIVVALGLGISVGRLV